MLHLLDFFSLLTRLFLSTVNADCTISINSLHEKSPLILQESSGKEKFKFYVPNIKDKIAFSEDQLVTLACPGNVIVIHEEVSKKELVRAACKLGKFQVGRRKVHFEEIHCKTYPSNKARYTGECCLRKHREIEVGFTINQTFLKVIDICFNEKTQMTLYTLSTLEHTASLRTTYYKRVRWKQGVFYNLSGNKLNKLYHLKVQRDTVNSILGLPLTSKKYIGMKKNCYLARGHLAPKTDFLYASQHHATFYLVNAIPQWQPFNAGSWLRLEKSVRRYAYKLSKNFLIYTGTYGVTSLPSEDRQRPIPLNLYVVNGTRLVPVPRLLWKVIYDPISKNGIACVGVNNVFILDKERDIICDNICNEYDWLEWCGKPIDVYSGYLYCCKVDEFRKVVTSFPEVLVTSAFRSGSSGTCSYTLCIVLIIGYALLDSIE
ncbi:hypothetical protein Trydic_g23670 [Trypoxylus dichotomus]